MRGPKKANLYDELDPLYRAIWGPSLHHGLFLNGHDSPKQARQNLVELVLDALRPQGTIADIGCGYGTLARELITRFDCRVIANTDSQRQADLIPGHPDLTVLGGDWLGQPMPMASLDGAVAVESLSHFPDYEKFFDHTVPALKIGARLVIADWFSETGQRFLLRHLAATGGIPPWRSLRSLRKAAERRNLELVSSQNLSRQVAPTWSHLFRQALFLPLQKPASIATLFKQALRSPTLLGAFPLLRLAYETGDLSYHLLTLRK